MHAPLPVPKYHQVYLVLRQELEEGRYAKGVPPELWLTEHFKVSRVTIRRALAQLSQEGLIVREAGRGTRPTTRPTGGRRTTSLHSAPPAKRIAGLLGNIVEANRSTSIQLLEWQMITASESIAEALQVELGAKVRKVVRYRSTEAGPVSHTTSYLAEPLARLVTRAQVGRRPMLQLLADAGVNLGRARQTVSARQADAEVASRLDVTIGSALLFVRRLVFDTDERPVQLLHGLYRPDRYEYQMELSQAGGIEARVVAADILP